MLTIFTIPKAFEGHSGLIQNNAICSWTRLQPAAEIILMGDDPGTADAAAESGVRHVPDIACNDYGTPLVSDAFPKAEELASHDILCYVNADIVLMNAFLQAVEQVARRHQRFLMIGQRWNIDIADPLDFEKPDWEERLRHRVRMEGKLQKPLGSDYFVFRRGTLGTLPTFAVGRAGWDNWLIYHARALGLAVVDATRAAEVVHQNHDYGHVPDSDDGKSWTGPETNQNRARAGGAKYMFTLADANWMLTGVGLTRRLTPHSLYRRVQVLPLLQLPTALHDVIWPLWYTLTTPHRAIPLAVKQARARLCP